MLVNKLKLAIRTLKKNSSQTLINLLGLSLAFAIGLFAFQYIQDELLYDTHHEQANEIYKVSTYRVYPNGSENHFASSPAPLYSELLPDYPEVIASTRMHDLGELTVRRGGVFIKETDIFLADSTFFDVFKESLLRGNPETALVNPNSVVITEEMASKYFGEDDPMGEFLEVGDWNLTVTGVIETVPDRSQMRYNFLVPLTEERAPYQLTIWTAAFVYHTYTRIQPGTDITSLEQKFEAVVPGKASPSRQQLTGETYEEYVAKGNLVEFKLTNIQDIHMGPFTGGLLKPVGNATTLFVLGIIAVCILLVSGINFINLSIASALPRAKDVGVRKSLGASRYDLIKQFLLETSLLCLLAMVLAVGMLALGMPYLNDFLGKNLTLLELITGMGALVSFSLLVLLSIGAGIFPAIIVSSFKPALVLKGMIASRSGKSRFRDTLVTFQFIVSTVLLISTFTFYYQIDFMKKKDLGFNEDQLISLKGLDVMEPGAFSAFKQELKSDSEIRAVSGISHVFSAGNLGSYSFSLADRPLENTTVVQTLFADYDLLETLEVEVIQGREFLPEFADSTRLIINKEASKRFEWQDNAIGKWAMSPFIQVQMDVIGVVDDFHFQPLNSAIEPMFYILNDGDQPYNFAYIRIGGQDIPGALAHVESVWNRFVPNEPFEFSFVDLEIDQVYKSEEKSGTLLSLFAIIAILISVIGLFGLASFSTEQRKKEIGIRKVLGANTLNVLLLLSRTFAIMIGIAFLFAIPAGWYIMNEWLNSFAYHIELNWVIFMLPALLVSLFALGTISFKILKIARLNPVHSIRQ